MSSEHELSIDRSIPQDQQQSYINSNNQFIFRNILIASSATNERYDLVSNRESDEKIRFSDTLMDQYVNQVNYFNTIFSSPPDVLPIEISRGLNQDNYLDPHPTVSLDLGIFSLRFEDFNDSIYFTDDMKDKIIDATNKWNSVITGVPGNDQTRKITVDINFKDFGNTGTLASAGPREKLTTVQSHLPTFNPYFIQVTLTGEVSFAINSYQNYWNDTDNIQMRETTKHELGHVLGIGNYWLSGNHWAHTILENQEDRLGNFHRLYMAPKAVEIYNYYEENNQTLKINDVDTHYSNKNYPNVAQCVGIPIEDNGGEGTANGHLEEGVVNHIGSHNSIFINDVHYPGFGVELMTGITQGEQLAPLSAITVGLLEDLGYSVDYSNAEPYELGVGAGITNIEPLVQQKIITSIPFTEIGNTTGMASIFNENGNTGPDFIYKYTPSNDENIKVTTCSENTYFDTVLNFKSTSGTFAPRDDDVDCEHSSTHSTRLGFGLIAGEEYEIIVSGKSVEDSGQYEISITLNHH